MNGLIILIIQKLSDYSLILVGNGELENKKNNQLYHLINSQIYDVINLTNKTSLFDLSSLIYFSSFIITNDTGVMHLSNLFKKKNISLFTFSDPTIFANYENSLVIIIKYDCQPCVNKSLREMRIILQFAKTISRVIKLYLR